MAEETKTITYTPAVGRRKEASARIRLSAGTGTITINDRPFVEYMPVELMRRTVLKPLQIVGQDKGFDVSVKVLGGGLAGQADAIALGIARALVAHDDANRPALKAAGLLTRDAREKERKKPGLRKARRAPQWSKR